MLDQRLRAASRLTACRPPSITAADEGFGKGCQWLVEAF
jgi:hypothetical protein